MSEGVERGHVVAPHAPGAIGGLLDVAAAVVVAAAVLVEEPDWPPPAIEAPKVVDTTPTVVDRVAEAVDVVMAVVVSPA